MSWRSAVAQWLPTLLAVILAAAAMTRAQAPPVTVVARRFWMAGLLVVGLLGIAGAVWQERAAADRLPPFDQLASADDTAAVSRLTHRVKLLEAQLKERQEGEPTRVMNNDAAAKLTDYLRPFGPRRVIVSCVPDNADAYSDPNQLANALRSAKWDAQGPEETSIFGDIRCRGVNVFVNADDRSDTGKILLDGFAKSNIAYQPRVTPTGAIPDAETVELFIGAAPSERVGSGSD
jgi:hypothetical protein